ESAGIVRRSSEMRDAAIELGELRSMSEAIRAANPLDPEAVEVRNLACVAELIVECALQRHESRGLHHNEDYPFRDNERFLRDTVLVAVEPDQRR
ncbi:MAG: L-aspartate oxidase, partial [Longimicrobiales bacterium]